MRYLIVALFILTTALSANAQIEKYQALFMYKFLQNFEWPAGTVDGGFKVGVLGSDEVQSQFSKLVNGRSIGGKSIEVIKYTPGSSTAGLCMVFISNKNKDLFESIQKTALGSSTVVVCESPGLAKKGAAVNFVTAGGSLKFELNESSLEASKVKASSTIKALAILVK